MAVAVAAFARRHQRAGRLGLCHGRAAAALERAEAEAEAGAGSQSTVAAAAAAAAAAGPGARAPSSSSATASPLHAPPHPPHPAGSSSRGIGRAAAAAAAAAALTVAEVRGRTQAPTIRALRAAFRPCRRRRGTVIDPGGTAGATHTAGGEGRRRQEGGGEWAGVDGSEAGGDSSWAAATSTLDGCAMQYGISAQDLAEFALYLGVDVAEEAELLPTVAQCAAAELPSGWHERLDPGGSGESYYWRIQHQQLELGGGTGHEVQWEHPLDEGFRSAISLQRAARSGQADHHSATSLNQLWQTLTSSHHRSATSEQPEQPALLGPALTDSQSQGEGAEASAAAAAAASAALASALHDSLYREGVAGGVALQSAAAAAAAGTSGAVAGRGVEGGLGRHHRHLSSSSSRHGLPGLSRHEDH
eukprot:COSAG01_NODE_6802_length_3493_cov_3.551856_1_plen_416_part_10